MSFQNYKIKIWYKASLITNCFILLSQLDLMGGGRAYVLRVPQEPKPSGRSVPKRSRGSVAQEKEVNLDDEGLGFDNGNWVSVVDNEADQRLLTRGGNGGDA